MKTKTSHILVICPTAELHACGPSSEFEKCQPDVMGNTRSNPSCADLQMMLSGGKGGCWGQHGVSVRAAGIASVQEKGQLLGSAWLLLC